MKKFLEYMKTHIHHHRISIPFNYYQLIVFRLISDKPLRPCSAALLCWLLYPMGVHHGMWTSFIKCKMFVTTAVSCDPRTVCLTEAEQHMNATSSQVQPAQCSVLYWSDQP